ncbi:glycosyltransferase [Adlercreutzia caecimuris]|uniref:glycosyltransferase n=1 Tax=Adlercreutzia caecimuris TaxID=671266 RepID=UPI00214CA532|nr:glycosyltransferase [Adlercreutzia caecimuris]MCR2038463.1 glycosyltransferase [Adlercreutzia caecimuris]
MNPKISVIVPVCNVEKYLASCLESALKQSLSDIEIICINDGSTDSSLDILRKFAARDIRVSIIDKANAGYGAAMNDGLRMACGEYIGILESDDRVCENAWQTLFDLASENDLDLVRGSYFQFKNGESTFFDANRKVDRACPKDLPGLPFDEPFKPLDYPRCFWINPCIWTGLYRREFLTNNDIWFNETPGASYQDTGFAFKTWTMAERAMVTETPVIYYNMDNEGSSSKSRAKVYAVCDEMAECEHYLASTRTPNACRRILAAIRYKTYVWNRKRVAEEFENEFKIRMWNEVKADYRAGHIRSDFFKPKDLKLIAESFHAAFSASVIITANDDSRYLRRCFDSIVEQRHSDVEVICTFASEQPVETANRLMKSYGSLFPSLIIQNAHNGATGDARNIGLSCASGKFVLFVSEHDALQPNSLFDALQTATQSDAEILLMSGEKIPQKGGAVRRERDWLKTNLLPAECPSNPSLFGAHIFQCTSASPRGKLFDRAFLEILAIQCEPNVSDGDPCFTYSALKNATRIAWIDAPITLSIVPTRRMNDQSLEKSVALLSSISHWHERLKLDDSSPAVKASYQMASLSLVIKEAEALINDRLRMQFLDKLRQYQFIAANELTPAQIAGNGPATDKAEYLNAAMRQLSQSEMLAEPCPYRVQTSFRDNISPEVTVVMPVYNAMPYLSDALRSIQEQSLGNIQIVCINDGSCDESLEALMCAARNDLRIQVVDQENLGQSRARNVGIDLARGAYIYFMDADDLLERNALEKLLNVAQEKKLDLLCFDGDTIYETEKLAEQFPTFAHAYNRYMEHAFVCPGVELMATLKGDGAYFQSPCLYLTRRTLLEDHSLRFLEGIQHEDNAFTFDCFCYAKRAAHCNETLFHRRVREASTMTSPVSFSRAYGYFSCYENMLETYSAIENNISKEARALLLRIIYSVLSNARKAYAEMPAKERGRELALIDDYKPFLIAVKEPATKAARLEKTVRQLKEEQKKVRQYKNEIQALENTLIRRMRRKILLPYQAVRDRLAHYRSKQ